MPSRRILSLWFPRLAAERWLRAGRGGVDAPFAVAGERRGQPVLVSLSGTAAAAGLRRGQPLRDARAMCPDLVTRPEAPAAEAEFLAALQRWAGRFSPWIAAEPPEGLVADLTGCAHLFGGEAALIAQVAQDCAGLGLTVRAGLADTLGGAWALARFAGGEGVPDALRSGDAIEQEARATRSRAARRQVGERMGGRVPGPARAPAAPPISAPGQTARALAPLPVAALRLPDEVVAQLARLGLRRIGELAEQPRGPLARRFGQAVLLRLDQALGAVPEPVSPAAAPPRFAVRLTLPEPIGREVDVAAALDRLLPELAARLAAQGRGARRVRLRAERCDRGVQAVEVGLARPTAEPASIAALLRMKLGDLDAGPGFDVIRLDAPVTEPVHAVQHRGQLAVSAEVRGMAGPGREQGREQAGASDALDDLIGRLGARIGLERILRLHPAESHLPEKATQVRAAAWAAPATDWGPPAVPRPLTLVRPEPVTAAPADTAPAAAPPARFRWRRRDLTTRAATGPERIAPEWWLDDPDWRSGVRDYWQVETADGLRLWLFHAHGAEMSAGWFCHGVFA